MARDRPRAAAKKPRFGIALASGSARRAPCGAGGAAGRGAAGRGGGTGDKRSVGDPCRPEARRIRVPDVRNVRGHRRCGCGARAARAGPREARRWTSEPGLTYAGSKGSTPSQRCSMAVKIQWQPPLVLEERKKVQWEKIIRHEVGDVENPPDVSLHFEADSMRWKVEAQPARPSEPRRAAPTRGRLDDALRAAGKPVV